MRRLLCVYSARYYPVPLVVLQCCHICLLRVQNWQYGCLRAHLDIKFIELENPIRQSMGNSTVHLISLSIGWYSWNCLCSFLLFWQCTALSSSCCVPSANIHALMRTVTPIWYGGIVQEVHHMASMLQTRNNQPYLRWRVQYHCSTAYNPKGLLFEQWQFYIAACFLCPSIAWPLNLNVDSEHMLSTGAHF